MNLYKQKLWKRIVSITLAVVIALITPLAVDFTSKIIKGGYDFDAVLSAYAAEIVDLDTAVALNEEVMHADSFVIDLYEEDGTNTLYLFSEPISYVDEEGNLKTKDITVEEQTDEALLASGYDYTNGQNDYRILFSSNSSKGVKVQSGNCTYTIVPVTENQVLGEEAIATYLEDNFEVFTYPKLYGEETTLRFYPQLNGVKEEIVLDKNIGQSVFSFVLTVANGTAVKNEDGTVSLIDSETQEEVQVFAAPYAYDSVYVEGIYDEHYGACEYELTTNEDGTYTLSVSVDEEWLNSESTTYPVIIDPTTSNISATKDAGVYSGQADVAYGKEQQCCFGRATGLGYGRALYRFDMPTAIEAGAVINSAYIWLRETTGIAAQTYVRPYIITSSWPEATVTWNSKPTHNTSVTMPRRNINSNSSDNADSPYWYKFNIAKAVKKWADGEMTNRGLMFISEEETDKEYQWRGFASKQHATSSYKPYTVISYTNDSTAPTFEVEVTPTGWTKGNVTVTIKNAKDNDGGCGLHGTPYSISTGTASYTSSLSKAFSANCTVTVTVRDARGNARSISKSITNIDKTAPTINSVIGAPTSWTKEECELTVTATDSQSGVSQYSFSTTAGTYSWQPGNTYQPEVSGTHYIYVKDVVGNISPVHTVNVLSDTSAPTAPTVISSVDLGIVSAEGITLKATSNDIGSGVAQYSFSTSADTYNWKTTDEATFYSNCTVYVRAKDKAGNISEVTKVEINNIDCTTYSGMTLTTTAYMPTNGNATVYYITNGAISVQLAEKPYCFISEKGAYTDEDWQAEASKEFTENQTVYAYLKLADGTVVYKGSIDINMIDRNAPTLENVTTTVGDTETTITFDANDPEHTTFYASIDGGATWELNEESFTIANDSVNAVTLMVKDMAGNVVTKTIDFVQPGFYREGELVGLYNPILNSGVGLQYKIGNDGEWKDYKVPFAIPAYVSTTVYARTTNSASAMGETDAVETKRTYYIAGEDIGAYTESNTDYTITYKGVSFNIARSYSSADGYWNFSTSSTLAYQGNSLIWMLLPDLREMVFVKTEENIFTNEIYGYTINYSSGQWILEMEGTYYTYNSVGKLVKVSNTYGHTITFTYSGSNVTISDGAGRTCIVARNSNGDIQSITDVAGDTINYTWENSNLTKVTDQAGVIVGMYQYNDAELLSKSMDMAITYEMLNSAKRVVKYTYNSGAYINVEYTFGQEEELEDETIIPARSVYTINSVGETTLTTYNDAFMPIYEESDGSVTEYVYDDCYRVLTESADGTTTTYIYDENGNLISQTTGTGDDAENTTYTYDSENRLIKEACGRDVTYYIYNELDEVILTATLQEKYEGEIPEAYDSALTCFDTISYTYDNGMVMQSQESVNAETSTYTYDAYGNVVSVSTTFTANNEQQSTSVVYTYDSLGNVKSITERTNDEITKETSYVYDEAGRTLLVNEDGNCTRTIYDIYGRVIREIGPEDYDATKDGLNNESPENTYADATAGHTYVYNPNTWLLTSETDRYGRTTTYLYHTNGNVKKETFDIYEFWYLSTGELEKVITDGVQTIAYTYNSDGNVLTETYGNDDIITYEYTESGDLLKQLRNGVEEVTYTYNEDGELINKVDSESGLIYEYNGANIEVYQDVTDSEEEILLYSYSEQTDETNESTTLSETHFGTSYVKELKENLTKYIYDDIAVSYSVEEDDKSGKILSESVKNGDDTILTGTYTYDDENRVTKKGYLSDSVSFLAEYDDEDRIIATGYGEIEQYYFYDENDQLIRVNNGSDASYTSEYTYDNRGNILSKKKYAYTENTTAAMTPTETTTFEYKSTGWVDQLVKVNDDVLTYDENGNVLTYGDKVYTWERGRVLKSITEGENTYSFAYDEDGLRTRKTANGVTTYYNYVDGRIVSQWNENDIYPMIFEYDSNGQPVGFSYQNSHYYYLTNQMGDVIAITDANGSPIAYYHYDEWGNLLSILTAAEGNAQQMNVAMANPLRYRGYYYDNETGLYYVSSRYYDPENGRFLNSDDPMFLGATGNIASYNLFAYCENNPVNYKDPSGYGPTGTIIGAILGFGLGALLVPRVADLLKLRGWGRKVFIALGVAALTGLGAYVGNYVGEAIFAIYKAGGAFALKINEAIANGIAKIVGGSIKAASGNGWIIKIGKFTLRIMTSGGGRTNYFRLSHATKGALTILGKYSGDRGLTHIPITFSNIIKIINLISKLLKK